MVKFGAQFFKQGLGNSGLGLLNHFAQFFDFFPRSMWQIYERAENNYRFVAAILEQQKIS